MAQRQIRGGLSAILRNRRRGAKLDWSVSRLLQRTTTSFEPRRPHPGSSLLRSSSAPRGGLTPAEAPLIDAEFLYRQPGPVHFSGTNLNGTNLRRSKSPCFGLPGSFGLSLPNMIILQVGVNSTLSLCT